MISDIKVKKILNSWENLCYSIQNIWKTTYIWCFAKKTTKTKQANKQKNKQTLKWKQLLLYEVVFLYLSFWEGSQKCSAACPVRGEEGS